MLLYNKHLLFNMQGENIKVSQPYLKHAGSMTKQQNLLKFCLKKSVTQKLWAVEQF